MLGDRKGHPYIYYGDHCPGFRVPRQLITLFDGTPVSLYMVQNIVYHSGLTGGFFGGGFRYEARQAAIKAPTAPRTTPAPTGYPWSA